MRQVATHSATLFSVSLFLSSSSVLYNLVMTVGWGCILFMCAPCLGFNARKYFKHILHQPSATALAREHTYFPPHYISSHRPVVVNTQQAVASRPPARHQSCSLPPRGDPAHSLRHCSAHCHESMIHVGNDVWQDGTSMLHTRGHIGLGGLARAWLGRSAACCWTLRSLQLALPFRIAHVAVRRA
jgi:hypothetical protein